MKNFTDIKLTFNTLHNFVIRTAILNALKMVTPQLKGNLLDVGCGKMPYKNFILKNSEINSYEGLDIDSALNYDENIKPDFTWDGQKMPFENKKYDCIIATEVLEHVFEPEIFLKEIHRVLKSNGIFFLTVPFLWNLHETPYDAYRFTPFSLERHLKNSGFNSISLHATGGWHASMAQMLGLWVKRSSMSVRKKRLIGFFTMKIIPILLKYDNRTQIKFSNGQMITGIYGIIKK